MNAIPENVITALRDLDTVSDENVEQIVSLAERAADAYKDALCLTDEEVEESGAKGFYDDLMVGVEDTKASEYGQYLSDKGALLATIGQDVAQIVQFLGIARIMALGVEDDSRDVFNGSKADEAISLAEEIRGLYPETSWVRPE